jgi:glycerol 3-phosphatase-2
VSDDAALTPLVASYSYVLLDLDGCIYVGDEAVPGAVEAVSALRAAGKGVAFITNDARRSGEDYVRKLWGLGLQASLEEVVTVGGAIQHVLAETDYWRTAYVVGAPVMHRHVTDAGLKVVNGRDVPAPDVVVLAAHDAFSYDELRDAVQAVLGGAALVCAGRDATFPMPDGPWPGTGAVVAAVEAATGVAAVNLGKPAAQPFRTALERLGVVLEPAAGAASSAPPAPASERRPSAAERLAARGRFAEMDDMPPEDELPAGERAGRGRDRAAGARSAADPAAADGPRSAGDPAAPLAPRALVVGDRLESDLAGAHAAGLDAAIVLTGATTAAEARAASDPAPVAVADSLAALVLAGG